MKTNAKPGRHEKEAVAKAATFFFTVRGIVRTRLAQGKKLDPSAWLRIETLKFIGDNDGPSMSQVADYLSITAPSATSLVSGLVKEKLVLRRVDARDRRASRLVLSRKGKAVLEHAVEKGMALLGELFSVLSEAELAAFTRALARIKESCGR